MKNKLSVISATLLFLQKEEEVLLAMKKRGFGANWWNGVGGKLEAGETIEEAAVRETQEEIGVMPKTLKHVANLYFEFTGDGSEPEPDMEVSVFTSHEWDGEPAETEEMAPKWFNLSEIPYDSMWSDDKYWLPRMLEGQILKGYFRFDKDNEIIDHKLEEVGSL